MNFLDRWLLSQAVKKLENKLEGNKMLSGYKTYIIAVAIGLITVVHQLGYIDNTTYQTLLGVLGAGGLFTLRNAISNSTGK